MVIAQSLIKSLGKQMDRAQLTFSQDAINAINSHPWPGNVREMINKVKRAIIMADGKRVTAADLELNGDEQGADDLFNLRQVRETAERNAINQALYSSHYNMAQAARLLGITRPTLYNLTDKYKIETSPEASSV